jgi:hypothetical protein
MACSDSELIYEFVWTFGRTPWTGDQPDAGPLPTQDNTRQKNVDIHPCLERDSNPRSQCSSGRRQYVTQTARPLGTAGQTIRNKLIFIRLFLIFSAFLSVNLFLYFPLSFLLTFSLILLPPLLVFVSSCFLFSSFSPLALFHLLELALHCRVKAD